MTAIILNLSEFRAARRLPVTPSYSVSVGDVVRLEDGQTGYVWRVIPGWVEVMIDGVKRALYPHQVSPIHGASLPVA